MGGLRDVEESRREREFLELTSLTVEEFDEVLPSFEAAFQEHMKQFRLDGQKRVGRAYTTYANCPLPTPQDRLLFILVSVKTNALQVAHGRLFGLPQNKANQWIHTLLPVLQRTLRTLGDAPARSMEQLAQRLGEPAVQTCSVEAEVHSQESVPLFAMMEPSDGSNAPKMRINKQAIIVARKNAIQ
jgi:hypothetical protein